MGNSETSSGEVVLHYRIAGRLGAGGMGVVFKAFDLRLQRYVALKFLPPDLLVDASHRARLQREATAASALEHPNIGMVHAIEETPQGLLFIVMSYYEGETLKQRLERSALSSVEFYDIALQTARGLAEAHRKGIIHRDIKPSNLILTPAGVVKIVDFGLAKIQGGVDLTQSQMTMGTAAYMSPEQALARLVDNRSDIWSYGVMLYEMITRRLPFHGDSAAALLLAVINSGLPPLDDLPRPLRQIVGRCLAKSPAERYSTMTEVIAQLEKAAKTEAHPEASSVETITLIPAPQPSRKHWAIGSGVGATILAAAAGAWLLTRHPSPPTSQPQPEKVAQAARSADPTGGVAAGSKSDATRVPASSPRADGANEGLSGSRTDGTTVAAARPGKKTKGVDPTVERHSKSEIQVAARPAYSGPSNGRLVWVGQLSAGQVLDLAKNSEAGSVSGSLPGVPVSLEIHPDTVHVVTPPGPQNQWRGLEVRNDGKMQVTVVISWHVISR